MRVLENAMLVQLSIICYCIVWLSMCNVHGMLWCGLGVGMIRYRPCTTGMTWDGIPIHRDCYGTGFGMVYLYCMVWYGIV